ncbi:MAG TPA: acetyl-coenzyme A synthetase N-terminal domain-containing protein, partial [Steroidobacteraceae bacterium]|nr:acetyl-coenzyme A synthetase N-terminal domain-containing protein [Steroidobacteraceae bacterium]
MTERSIESALTENRIFPPSAAFAATAQPNSSELSQLRAAATADTESFWADQARHELRWHKPFTQTLDAS